MTSADVNAWDPARLGPSGPGPVAGERPGMGDQRR